MSALALVPKSAAPAEPSHAFHRDLNGIVHLLTCGSVDDGKSTLIGRLLWDASDLYEDQRENVRRSGRKAAGTDLPDFSMLLDGLVAEREQGITIDIAWKYFDTETRRFVIIDSPGHEQYTRNMASGASHADVAILLVDARAGVKKQTRRHAAILDLVGVKRVVLPRVLTVQEIAAINREIDVETEVFIFGGLCVMAEGRCSLSSYATGKSPNTAESGMATASQNPNFQQSVRKSASIFLKTSSE